MTNGLAAENKSGRQWAERRGTFAGDPVGIKNKGEKKAGGAIGKG